MLAIQSQVPQASPEVETQARSSSSCIGVWWFWSVLWFVFVRPVVMTFGWHLGYDFFGLDLGDNCLLGFRLDF